MTTISIANSKGGVGKTTTTVGIAHAIGQHSDTVTVVDLDPQGSAASWFAVAEAAGQPVRAALRQVDPDAGPAKLARLIAQAVDGASFAIIDTPPGDVDRIEAAVEAAVGGGMVLIPTSPSELDLPRAAITARDVEGLADCAILITKARAGTRELAEARPALVDEGLDVLNEVVPLRTSMTRLGDVRAVGELYEAVAAEILERIG